MEKIKKINRDVYVKFRVTAFEKEILKHRADNTNLKLSDFCRNSIFNKRINYAFTEAEEKVYLSLIKYNNGFEKIANYFKYKDEKFSSEVRKIAQELKEEIRYIRSLRNGRKSS